MKESRSAYHRRKSLEYYYANKDKALLLSKENSKRLRARKLKALCEYLTEHPCVDCGESDIRVLEFDHLRDKTAPIAQLISHNASDKRIHDEMAKCDTVCANCHRKRTAERGNWYKHIFKNESI